MQSIKSLVKTQSSGLITCFSVLFRRRLIRSTSVAAWSHTNRKLFTSSPIASENFRIATCRWSIASPLISRISVRSYGDLPVLSGLPQHKEIRLPALSPTMNTGSIISWEKEEGEELMEGDVLAQVETDKATMDMDSPQSGYMAKIIVPTGTKDIPLGTLVCIIVENKEDVTAFTNYQPAPTTDDVTVHADLSAAATDDNSDETMATAENVVTSKPQSATSSPSFTPKIPPTLDPTNTPSPQTADRIFASPYARKLAAEKGINLKSIKGTGLEARQRIVSHDIQSTSGVDGNETAEDVDHASFKYIELSSMRKTIAKRLQESKQNIPHYYMTVDVRMDELLKLRQDLNTLGQGEYKLTVTDFIIKASAATMSKAPQVNSSWEGDHIRQYNKVDISMAVSTDRGLITPIIFGADSKGLLAISSTTAELAQKAREGKLQPNEFQGGTFTISNLGMYGIKQFTAIINLPQACILAVGVTEKRIIDDTAITRFCTKADMMTVTLSCDHRVVDGAVAASWLTAFKKTLENPYTMLL